VLRKLPAGEYIYAEWRHRRCADWTPERFQRWGRSVGPNREGLILAPLANPPHPEQGFRSCVGVMRLLRDIDPKRAEQVAGRAIEIGALNYKSIASILAHNLDRRPSAPAGRDTVIVHANIRGPRYFH
jgi:transposase